MLKSLGVLLLVGVATSSVLADEGTPYGLESEDGGDPDNASLLKEDRADLMEDEFIDQSDLFNYDPVTRTMRNKKERKDVIDMVISVKMLVFTNSTLWMKNGEQTEKKFSAVSPLH